MVRQRPARRKGAGARSVHLAAPVPPDARRLRAVLFAVSIALMAVIASVSGLNVAQTHLAVEWSASQGTVLWIVNVHPLVLAALLLPLGALGDRLGRKPVLVAGLVLFGAPVPSRDSPRRRRW